jgi:hypothetical protein
MGELQGPDDPPPKLTQNVFLQALKWFGVGLGLIMMMMGVGAVLLVGFLIYACGHH